jgi:hypothetical protein
MVQPIAAFSAEQRQRTAPANYHQQALRNTIAPATVGTLVVVDRRTGELLRGTARRLPWPCSQPPKIRGEGHDRRHSA